MAQWLRIYLPMQEMQVQSLGKEDPLEKEMATHSSVLAWEIQGQRSQTDYSPWGCKNHAAAAAAAAAKSLQSCPTLCDPVDGSPPGSPVPGILQARKLEWVVP